MKTTFSTLTFVAAVAFATPAWTQSAAKPADTGQDVSADNGMKDLGENMTRDQYEALVKKANENRLKAERELAAAEINSGFYDPSACEDATALLRKNPRNTQRDNIDRICRAYASVDAKFGELWKLYNAKKYKEAVALGKSLVPPNNTASTYLMAAKAFVYSEALAAAGGDYNVAADAYTDLATNMTDRISFAAEAVTRLAKLYEANGRNIYAMQTYAFLLKNYGLTMDARSFDDTLAKVKRLQDIYGDPLGTVTKMMSEVKERLAKVDSGKETQITEKNIVAILDDWIKTLEDMNSPSGAPQPNTRPDGPPKPPGPDGQPGPDGKPVGEKPVPSGLPNGRRPPTNPRRRSTLTDGNAAHQTQAPAGSRQARGTEPPLLSPEEVGKLIELCRMTINGRYRDVIIDYHKSIASVQAGH